VRIIDAAKTICSLPGNLVNLLGYQVTYRFALAAALAQVAVKP
jgi:hypothetical protein